AYEYLLSKTSAQSTPVEQSESREPSPGPAPPEDQSQDFSVEPEEPGRGPNVLWNILFSFAGLVLIACGILWWGGHHKTNTISTTSVDVEARSFTSESNAVAAEQQATNIGEGSLASVPPRSTSTSPGPVSGDILESMVAINNVGVLKGPEGVTLSSTGSWAYIQSPQSIRPPLVIRTRAKTDLNNIRLYYGIGRVIFNWESNPAELRVQDPLTGRTTPVPGQGFLTTKEWHELVWEISTNAMKISVDGELRFEGKGYYSSINAFPGIGPLASPVTVNT